MCTYHFSLKTSDDKAFDDVAILPFSVEGGIAFVIQWELILEILAALHTTAGDEEVVDADDGDPGCQRSTVLETATAAHNTPFAPVAIWYVYAPVLFYLLLARQLGVGSSLDHFHVLIFLNGDVLRVLIVSNRHECITRRTMSDTTDATSCIVNTWTYGSRA